MLAIVLFCLIRLCLCEDSDTQYVLSFDSQMDCCDDESTKVVDVSNVSVDQYNDSISWMYGDIEFFEDIGEDTVVEIILEKEASGEYQVIFNHLICNVCEEIGKGENSDYYSYMKYFGLPDECPFSAAKYPIKHFVVDTDDLPVDSNSAGRYRGNFKMYRNPELDCKTLEPFLCLTIRLIIDVE